MSFKTTKYKLNVRELLFQVLLNAVVFIFFAFDRRLPGIELHRFFFFLNFAIAAIIINYYLLPKFLYKNKYLAFVIYVSVIVAVIIFIEEAILEKIFYPDTRGRKFLGVFYNLLSTLPTLTVLVGFKFAWDAIMKQREVTALKNSVKESELQFLKSQINPHFLFNNLNNLYAHAVEGSAKTPEIILELSAVLRYMLYECKAKYVPLPKEIEQLNNYINLNSLQLEDRSKIDFKVENKSSGHYIAPLILMVFVENAFKHCSSSQTKDIEIEIALNVSDKGILNFKCKNTYLAQSNTESLDGGIGLDNVRKRLKLIYPKSHRLDINTENGYYIVDLTMDLNKTKER